MIICIETETALYFVLAMLMQFVVMYVVMIEAVMSTVSFLIALPKMTFSGL